MAAVGRLRAVARHLGTAAPSTIPNLASRRSLGSSDATVRSDETFIDVAKRMGANALLGAFLHTGTRFDRVLDGMQIVRIDSEAGEVDVELEVTESLQNTYGTLHGGATSTIVDVVGTLALLSKDPTRAGVSVELSVTFLVAAKGSSKILCRGRVLKAGKKLGFTEVDIFSSDGILLASGKHTKAL